MKGKRRAIRFCICMVALILLGAGAIGTDGTYGWNAHEVFQENNLQSRNATVEIVENFPDDTIATNASRTKEVSFKNTGTSAVFVRVAVSERWESASEILLNEMLPTKNWTGDWTADWEMKSDGWWYYKKILPAGAVTNQILSSVTFPADCPDNAVYNLEFMVETVQASDEAAVNTAATQAAFGKTGTISGTTTENGAVIGGTVAWS